MSDEMCSRSNRIVFGAFQFFFGGALATMGYPLWTILLGACASLLWAAFVYSQYERPAATEPKGGPDGK